MDLRALAKRLVPVVPLAALVAMVLLVALGLSSCGSEEPTVSLPPAGGIGQPGIPTIRVLLAAQPSGAMALSTTGAYRLSVDGRTLFQSNSAMGQSPVERIGRIWKILSTTGEGSELTIEPVGGFVCLNGVTYRGRIVFIPQEGMLAAVNYVDLESYLAGVLSKELYPYWDNETYRCLAVVARTYALYKMKTVGVSQRYDVVPTQGDQVYGGFTAESEKSWYAARQTHGWVLTYGQPRQEKIFLTQYSACNGGYVNGAGVIRDAPDIPPLRGGQKDDDGQGCKYYRWDTVRISKADIYSALAAAYPAAGAMGGVQEIRVASATPYGRAVWLDVIGVNSGKQVRVRAEDLRLALLRSGKPAAKGLYSMNCAICDRGRDVEFTDGRGFGHGVGLSQWGAEDKARKGWNAERILSFYYPGAGIFRAY